MKWNAVGGNVPVTGYTVKRYDAGGSPHPVGAACSGTLTVTTCTENNLPGGSWRYAITPVRANWKGTESPKSTAVVVVGPSFTITGGTTITSLPTTLSGTITGYRSGQTVQFRLDDPVTGPILTGSITPSPVPLLGTASASVTIPNGTSNGAHTIYAVGSLGDVASAAINVNLAVTISTTAWKVDDASSDTSEIFTDPLSFGADGLIFKTDDDFGTTFDTSRYLEFDFNDPLDPSRAISGAQFKLRYSSDGGGAVACFYFEVRRQSNNTVLATHGSPSAPVDCVVDDILRTVTTALPEITTGAIANNVRIRAYFADTKHDKLLVDQATIEGTAGGSLPFSLYETSLTDRADGSGTAAPWAFHAADSITHESEHDWAETAQADRFLKLSFPAYVPAGATVSNAKFIHTYRSDKKTSCYYFEVLSGNTVIGTHGSALLPVSCATELANQTDQVNLPEVTTTTRANNLSVKMYFSNADKEKTLHDHARLQLTYTP